MTSRVLFAVAAAALLVTASGCSTSVRSEEAAESASQIRIDSTHTVLLGSVAGGSSVTVRYTPSEYDASEGLPYLAVELAPTLPAAESVASAPAEVASAPPALSITVDGDFPGEPKVLVVDESFKIIASTNGTRIGDATRATLAVPPSTARRTVLIRDDLWVRPMPFVVSVQ